MLVQKVMVIVMKIFICLTILALLAIIYGLIGATNKVPKRRLRALINAYAILEETASMSTPAKQH